MSNDDQLAPGALTRPPPPPPPDDEQPDHTPLIPEETFRAFLPAFLSHFGAFAAGGAIFVGLYSSQVGDRVCTASQFLAGGPLAHHCKELSGLSTRLQLGLAGFAVVLLLLSEWFSRQYAQTDA